MIKFSLFPKEKKFFALFEQSAHNTLQIARQLKDMVYIWENVRERVGVITDLEHQGDAITHLIVAQLHRSFITPFDREDIALLAHSLDDVTDFIHATADTMYLYRVDSPTDRAKELSDIIVQAVVEVEKAVSEVQNRIELNRILKQCVEINRLENMADGIYRSAMKELFTDSKDMIHVIKWREIYRYMESAVDRCEDVADVLEGVALKYA